MRWLALLSAAWWAVSWMGLRAVGLAPVVPTSFLLIIAMQLPFAYALWATAQAPRQVPPIAGLLVGTALLMAPIGPGAWPWFAALVLFAVQNVWVYRHGGGLRLLGSFALLFVAYAAIWNSNYLAVWAIGARSWDALAWQMDRTLFMAASPLGMYPLAHAQWVIQLLERAYVYAFTEVMAVVLILAMDRQALRRFIARLLMCYALALVMFLCVPVIGPGVVYPESNRLRPPSLTASFMESTAREYRAVRTGDQPRTGFGYFVGAPSLHVAIAVLVWTTLRRRYPLTGWTLAPVNVVLIAATVVLGHHYVIDAALGFGLPAFSGWVWNVTTRRTRKDPAWAAADPVGA